MRRLLLVLLVFVVNASPVKANVVYTFATISPANLAGPLSGSFEVADSALLDGFITVSEVIFYSFSLPSAGFPFAPATFAFPDTMGIASGFGGRIAVDPATGNFRFDSRFEVEDGTTRQRLGVTTLPFTEPYDSQYQVAIGVQPFDRYAQGSGRWTIQRTVAEVPEPGSALLVGTALFLLALRGARRKKWRGGAFAKSIVLGHAAARRTACQFG